MGRQNSLTEPLQDDPEESMEKESMERADTVRKSGNRKPVKTNHVDAGNHDKIRARKAEARKAEQQILPSGEKEIWRGGNMLYPVPAVMVSCAREGEKPNIITAAWAGTVCSDPAMVSISVRPGRYSHDIIRETGEFVINLVSEDMVPACDWCGVKSGRDVDKFAYTWETDAQAVNGLGHARTRGENSQSPARAREDNISRARRDGQGGRIVHRLTPGRAAKLRLAPVILESPVSIECKVKQMIPLGSHDMFLAEVVAVDADKAYFDKNGRFALEKAGLTAYSHGTYYGLGKKLGTFGYTVSRKNL